MDIHVVITVFNILYLPQLGALSRIILTNSPERKSQNTFQSPINPSPELFDENNLTFVHLLIEAETSTEASPYYRRETEWSHMQSDRNKELF